MPQIFHRSFNTVSRVSIVVVVVAAGLAFFAAEQMQRSGYVSWQGVHREQPVPFSHKRHVGGNGIDCRYCHTSVETSSFAGIPPTKTCMNCHAQIWSNAPMLEPVRESFRSGRSIQWERANELPDFVYFDHSIHINKGVGCDSCHGQVDRMPLMYAEGSLQMEWCLDCHRAPEKKLRPREEVFNMRYEQPSAGHSVKVDDKEFKDQKTLGTYLLTKYHVRSVYDITSCNTCHR
jgi:hypothetical protein